MAEYPKLNPMDLEPHYCRHVSAMTSERLHAKSDIAIQLAWRDSRLAAVVQACSDFRATIPTEGLSEVDRRLLDLTTKVLAAVAVPSVGSRPAHLSAGVVVTPKP